MKQTAVDWLDRWFRDNPEATHEEGNKALKQAKQMEKEQIEDAFWKQPFPCDWAFEEYYKENYESE